MATQPDKTYTVPVSNFETLQERLKKLNRRAKKIGGELSLTVVGYSTIVTHRDRRIPAVEFRLEGEIPRVAGYAIVASLEHTKSGNLVLVAPGYHDLQMAAYHHCDANCDHCGSNRNRRFTVILENQKGERVQIGKTCLQDYTRTSNIGTLIDILSFVAEVEACDHDDYATDRYGSSPSAEYYLATALKEVRSNGFVPAAHTGSTRDVCGFLTGPPPRDDVDRLADWTDGQPSESDRAEVTAIVEYANGVDGDYGHNCRVAIERGYVDYKVSGLMASVVSGYLKSLADLRTPKCNEHVGAKGERIRALVLRVTRIGGYSSMYGYTKVVTMVDEKGRTYVWKTTSSNTPDMGDTVELDGTVKGHSEYRETRQTELSRCTWARTDPNKLAA